MARGRKGRPVSGWVVIDKPAGLTSTAVVNKVKWAFEAQKAGHAGTLDPAATGVLAVALGEATKTVPYVTDALKAYAFTVRLGQSTTTDDAEGEVTGESAIRPDDAAIKEALHAFAGDVMQVPPAFSAVKIDGERAYALARAGEEFDIAARPLWVEELVMTGRPDADHVTLEMTCGKGGYVRSVARDLGLALGCLGPFTAEQGVGLDQIEALARTPGIDRLLLPLEIGLESLPELHCPEASVAKLRNGNPAMVYPGDAEYGDTCWVSHGGKAVAVGQYRGADLHPTRVFVP
jgi:tRNA pseudouridine55 synthase